MTQDLRRKPAPATRPHALAYLENLLWMGSWDTDAIYGIDPQTWSVRDHIAAPGKPYGMTAWGDELRVVVGIGEEDDRYIYRFAPGRGFDLSKKTACPDFTGSYLAADGSTLYLGQMTNRRILALDSDCTVQRELALPTRCAGIGFGPEGHLYMISGDAELEHLTFGKLDLSQNAPAFQEILGLPDEARSLVHDGTQWWTSLREANEIASFHDK